MKILGMLKLGLILALFAVISCVMLAFVYTGTSAIIAQRQQADLGEALRELFPETRFFIVIDDITSPDSFVTIENAFVAVNGKPDNIPIGVVLTVSRASYSGPIKTMVGVNTGGFITGIKIMEHSDTPGLGANAASPSYFVDRTNGITFYGQFTGKKASDPFEVKNDIAVITASTVTSVAVSSSVKAAALAAIAWLEGRNTITSITEKNSERETE